MGAITDALTTITAGIAQALAAEVDVQEHPGRFTEEELTQILLKQRSVRVAVEQIPALEVESSGVRKAEIQFSAVVICADRKGVDRHQEALNIVETLASLIPYATWGDRQRFRAVEPKNITADNLYSGDIRGKGIAMWALSWKQTIRNPQE